MRILVLSNLYPPNVVGGYERLCYEVSSELATRGHEITVLTSTHGGKVADYPGQRILRQLQLLTGEEIYTPFAGTADERAAGNERNLTTLHTVLNQVKPDVVFAWNLFFLDTSMLSQLEASPFRTVVMLTDNWLLVMRRPEFVAGFFRDFVHGPGRFLPPAPPPFWRILAGRAKRTAQRLRGKAPHRPLEAIFGARFVRDLHAAGGVYFPSHRVIHNGVRQQLRSLPVPDRRRTVQPGELRLLFAGRLVDLKGVETVLEVLPHIDRADLSVERVTLTIVGDSQDRAYFERFQALLADHPCRANIILEPIVPEAELPTLFDRHDIYLFPSLYEPFSLTLIHALACGIPTIASDIGGNPEIIEDGLSGLLFRKGDPVSLAKSIARLALDPVLRARLARGGLEVSSRFTFERMTNAMEQFLRESA